MSYLKAAKLSSYYSHTVALSDFASQFTQQEQTYITENDIILLVLRINTKKHANGFNSYVLNTYTLNSKLLLFVAIEP